MRRLPLLSILVCLLFVAHARPASADLRIVATLPDLAALADSIGGDLVEIDVLAAPTEDPHYVDPRPSHLVTLRRADVLIANGLGLEVGWLPPLQTQSRNRSVQVGGDGYVEAAAFVTNIIGAEQVVDRSMGDVHPGGNPHFLFDPRAARDVAVGLIETFSRLDSENAGTYAANGATLLAALDECIEGHATRFQSLGSDRLRAVVYHDSMPYLLDWLGIEQVVTIEPTPGVPPDPGRVADVVRTIRRESVRVILQEEFYPSNTSRRIADLSDTALIIVQGGTRYASGETYVEHIAAIVDALYADLAR